jgi:hypothetical protein
MKLGFLLLLPVHITVIATRDVKTGSVHRISKEVIRCVVTKGQVTDTRGNR